MTTKLFRNARIVTPEDPGVPLRGADQGKVYHEKDLTLPTVRALPTAEPGPYFLRLLLASLPQITLVLARDWTLLRETFCKVLTRRTALRNGIRSGISSLPLRSVPGIGPVLAMLATSAETMMPSPKRVWLTRWPMRQPPRSRPGLRG